MTLDEKIYKYLKKIKLRLQMVKLIRFMLYGILLGLSSCSIVTTLSLFLPITYLYVKLIILFGLCLIIFAFIGVFSLPNEIDAAKLADKSGLKERAITAISLSASNNPFANIQKEDTLSHLQNFNYKNFISLKPKKSLVSKILILIIIFTTTLFIPAQPKVLAKKTEEKTMIKKEAIKKVEKLKQDTELEKLISDITKKDISKKLELLKNEITKTDDINSINKLIKKEEKNLSLMKQKSSEELLAKLADNLINKDKLKQLGESLKNANLEKANNSISELNKLLKNFSKEELEKLASDFSSSLNASGINMNISDLNSATLEDYLNQISKQLDNNNKYAKEQNGQNSNQSKTTAPTGQSSTQKNGNSVAQDSNSGTDQQSADSANGSGSGSNNGNGSGKGLSNNAGKGGNGRGTGSKESIFTDKELETTGESSQIKGSKGDGQNSIIQKTNTGIAIEGSSVPYNQVIGDYKTKAYKTIDEIEVPIVLEEVIKEYFSSLE